MESVYGTKKYFQGLSGGSNIYRGQSCRTLTNDFAYNSSLGRHSPIGPYIHMNKQSTYSTDLSVNSQCGYNTWGTMNDVRNIAPGIYTSKRPHKFRSFSIILTTAVLIVLVATISIGGLAFYFSSLKPNADESIIMFEGSFRIVKGDSFSSVIKNNQSAIFRQKVDFYKRFIERALSDNDLQPTKVDILSFGNGPLIDVQFVIMLDMQNVPQNVHSMEEHIRNSLFLETNSLKSLYKFLKIEQDSVRVKRVAGKTLNKIIPSLHQEKSMKQSHFENKLLKSVPKLIESTELKYTSTQTPKLHKNEDELDVDVEHAPTIQGSFEGSFEITKTDADITAKKASPTKSFSSHQKYSTASMSMRLKNKKVKKDEAVTTTPLPITEMPLTTNNFITTLETLTTLKQVSEPTTLPPGTMTSILSAEYSTATSLPEVKVHQSASFPPKLDMSLFTSAPILDTKPWQPIHPTNFQYIQQNYATKSNPSYDEAASLQLTFPGNKMPTTEDGLLDGLPDKLILYQSFTKPVFMPGTTGIEKLGSTDVKPYPIPISLIDDVVAPDIKSVLPMHKDSSNLTTSHSLLDGLHDSNTELNLFESSSQETTLLPVLQVNVQNHDLKLKSETLPISSNQPVIEDDDIGDILLGLLDLPNNVSTKPAAEETSDVREILHLASNITKYNVKEGTNSTNTKRNNTGLLNDAILYPTQTKWDHVRNEVNNEASFRNHLVKKYNETLQAVIVENSDGFNASGVSQQNIKRNSSENIENITLIFDTLASKLGITSSFPTKEPPFSTSSQQKHSSSYEIRQTSKLITSTPASEMPIKTSSSIAPTQLPLSSVEREHIVGEAEVEVVDPTKYEEMLSSQSASSTTNNPLALVTLLPVRSNSGIRASQALISSSAQGRRFSSGSTGYREAVVTTGIQVTT